MTTPRRIRKTAEAARLLELALATRLDHTITAVATALDGIDGYPTIASGAEPGGRGGGDDVSSSTERAALRRLTGATGSGGTTTPLDELWDLVAARAHIARLLHSFCDRWAGQLTAKDLERLRCISCGQFADPTRNDGRCIDHGKTEDDKRRRDAQRKRDVRYGRGAA